MTRLLVGITMVLVWLGCGSEVSHTPGQGGGGSGGSGTGQGGDTGSGGSGAAGGGTTTSSGQAGGSPGGCSGLSEAGCLAAYPGCAPIYDDVCCPTCEPGTCADCSDYEFYQCVAFQAACEGPTCGLTPEWACLGAPVACPTIVDPGDEYLCDQTPGCMVVTCSPDVNCVETQCHSVNPDACTTSCDAVPPTCPPGTVAEADGFCWTGFCMPAEVCGP